jgi:hypothetical protein
VSASLAELQKEGTKDTKVTKNSNNSSLVAPLDVLRIPDALRALRAFVVKSHRSFGLASEPGPALIHHRGTEGTENSTEYKNNWLW